MKRMISVLLLVGFLFCQEASVFSAKAAPTKTAVSQSAPVNKKARATHRKRKHSASHSARKRSGKRKAGKKPAAPTGPEQGN